MARFSYRAIDQEGEPVDGKMEATDQESVINQLRQHQLIPVAITPLELNDDGASGHGWAPDWLNITVFSPKQIKSRELALMTRELSTLLQAGLAVDQSLNFLAKVNNNPRQHKILTALLTKVQGGSSLADALGGCKAVFSPAYVSLVRAGEAGNALGTVLARLADYLGRNEALKQRVQAALLYPMVLLLMAIISVTILLLVVLPQFTPLFEEAGQDLPWLTRMVVGAGTFLGVYWWLVITLLMITGFWLTAQLRIPQSRLVIDRMLLKLPLIGALLIKINTTRFARTVSTLLSNGVALPTALAIAQGTLSNAILRDTISVAIDAVKEGKGLAETIGQSGLFPPLASHLIAVGEKSGRLESILETIEEIFDQEVSQTVDKMMTLLVPMLTIFVGFVIATIIGAILSAILATYQLPI